MDLKTDLYLYPSYKNGDENKTFTLTGKQQESSSGDVLSKLVTYRNNTRRNVFLNCDKLNIYTVQKQTTYEAERSSQVQGDLSVIHCFPFCSPTYKIINGHGNVLYQTEEDVSDINVPKVLVKNGRKEVEVSILKLDKEHCLELQYSTGRIPNDITIIVAMILYSHFYPAKNMCARVTTVACIALIAISVVLMSSCGWFPHGDSRTAC